MLVSRRFAAGSIALLSVVFIWRCHSTYRVFNDTKDEAVHIASGLEIWQTGQYTIDPPNPPLTRMLFALFAHAAGLRYSNPRVLWAPGNVEFYWRSLSAVRTGNLIFVPFLLAYIYIWGRQLYGPGAGLAAAALASLCPNLLAHASLATVDFGATTTGFISAYYFWRWNREPGLGRAVAAAMTFALAVLAKFSALVFLPALGVVFVLIGRRDERLRVDLHRWRTALLHAAVFLAVFLVVVWGGYRLQVGPLPPPSTFAPPGTFAQRLIGKVELAAGHNRIPAPAFVRGILEVLAKNAAGHPVYLLGRMSGSGWWYYFPVALAVKTTLPLLLLVLVGAAFWAASAGTKEARPLLTPLASAVAILLISMTTTLDLGVRYVLIIYPFLALIAAGGLLAARPLLPPTRRIFLSVLAAIAIWHVAESAVAHPDYLAYFNQIARGGEEKFLLDSNLDWGQDLERLRRHLSSHGVETVYLSYFGFTDPAWVGMPHAEPFFHGPPAYGWVAVSKNHMGGIDRHPSDFAWTRKYPAVRIGKSILLYHLTGPT